jgi:hypothetical protein
MRLHPPRQSGCPPLDRRNAPRYRASLHRLQSFPAAFQRARTFWGTLTDEQFRAWKLVGGERRTQTVLGRSSTVPGYLVAVSVNTHLAMISLPMVSDPPPVPTFPANPVVGLKITYTRGAVSLKLQFSRKPSASVLVFAARPQGPGVTYVDHYTFLGVLPEEDSDEVDITDLYVAKYGEPPAGKRIYIQTVQQINGWRDRPKTTSARVLGL